MLVRSICRANTADSKTEHPEAFLDDLEDQPPWSPRLRSRSVMRSGVKRQFVDPSLAVAALRAGPAQLLKDLGRLGFLFESLVVRDLRVYSQALDAQVLQYRDNTGLEVDAIVEMPDGMWVGVGYPYMQCWIPHALLFTYDVTGPHGYSKHYGPNQVRAHWTGAYVWDTWWNDFLEADPPLEPLNPRATVYGKNVLLPIGPFKCAGKYTVTESWWTAKPTVDRFAPGPPVYHPAGTEGGGITYDMWVE